MSMSTNMISQQNSRQNRTIINGSSRKNFVPKFKLVLLGESGVGKTALALRFAKDRFNEQFDSTIGAGFFLPTLWVEDEQGQSTKMKLEIWDTAGQERFRSITPMYIRGAKGAVVVYDITNRNSFAQAKYWVEYLRKTQLAGLNNQQLIIALVGNKLDLDEDRREVEWSQGQRYAAENNLIFIETSAKSSINVKDFFLSMAKVLFERFGEEEEEVPGNSQTERGIRGMMIDRMGAMREEARQHARSCCN